ncbi:MAG: LemA family protein [Gammaproteobacteria bacterium]|nr:LemA family protein [Gammaproteobacteria bacterium]
MVIYNLLVRDRNRVLTAWSDIDVQLKRRHDLIPKLVEAVKQYADYESSTLAHITELRSQSEAVSDIVKKGELETELAGEVKRLIALAEDYPELKANESYLDLQRNLTEVEQHLQYARRYYNGAVRNLNIRVQSFPDLLIAKLFGYRPAQYFQFET